MPSHAWIFCSSPQPPPWQHWWWQRASSGACVPLSLIAKKMASTVCANTETIMTTRSGSPLWAPKSPCLPTSFRTKAKATRRRCMPTKSEEHSKSFCLLSVLFEAQPPPRCLPKIKHLTHEDHHELDLHLFLWPVWRGWRLFLLHQYILFPCRFLWSTCSTYGARKKLTKGGWKKWFTPPLSSSSPYSSLLLCFVLCFLLLLLLSEPTKNPVRRPHILPGWDIKPKCPNNFR